MKKPITPSLSFYWIKQLAFSTRLARLAVAMLLIVAAAELSRAQEISVNNQITLPGQVKPIHVTLDGFSPETAAILRFDLYVQGFDFVSADAAQYSIHSVGSGNVAGTVTDNLAHKMILSRSYNGANLRRQAHAFADDVVQTILNLKPIGQTKIAFKVQPGGIGPGEIYVADFDGYDAQRITTDGAIVAKPAWVPRELAVYYTSYAPGNPDIYYHNLTTGQRRIIAAYSGLNTSAAVSPDGSRVAMVLSKSGSANIWVCGADGSGLRRVTTGVEDSSPAWSPDGRWICFATKKAERRRLAKVPADGGQVEYLSTAGAPNPTEPDWSPDGKWIAFTSQTGEFDICVIPAEGGGTPILLVPGQNPSWSPNSRTLIFNRHGGGGYREVLSVLDVFTKQYKDCARAPGSSSQAAWAR
ncbi:MAG TPA: LpqB family beta-propeller domain-containing protein [Candidatus Angelobacter sp.]|nr:LpqB family beta-propeller domain-containing protein [Candidatus Angelobacter sp.]